VSDGGLPWEHWIIAIVLGFLTWVVAFIVKFLPDGICPQFGKKDNKTEAYENIQEGPVKKPSVRREGSLANSYLKRAVSKSSKQSSFAERGDRYHMDKVSSLKKNPSLKTIKNLNDF
jgi:hypothetical protein